MAFVRVLVIVVVVGGGGGGTYCKSNWIVNVSYLIYTEDRRLVKHCICKRVYMSVRVCVSDCECVL